MGQKPIHRPLECADDSSRLDELLGRMNDSRSKKLGIVDTAPSSSSPSIEVFYPRTTSGVNGDRQIATVIEDGSNFGQCQIRRKKLDNKILEDSCDSYFHERNNDNTRDSVAARRARIRQKTTLSVGFTLSKGISSELESQRVAESMIPLERLSGSSELDIESDFSSSSEEEMDMKPTFVPRSKRLVFQNKQAGDKITTHTTSREHRVKSTNVPEMLVASIKHEIDHFKSSQHSAFPDDNDDIHYDEDFARWKTRELSRLKQHTEQHDLKSLEMMGNTKKCSISDIISEEDGSYKIMPKQKKSRKFMQKYYHKGAFYMDNTSLSKDENDVRKKSYDEVTGEDKFNLGALPKVLQVKNFGKRGRTKYTHLMDQDTTSADGYMLNQ